MKMILNKLNPVNKYAVFISLYDNRKISEYNLYYYKGIIHNLTVKNRDYDIYIDTTEYCKKKILDIANQEELSLNNVYFTIHDDCIYSDGMLWKLNTLLNNINKYECLLMRDSDFICNQQFHSIEDLQYGLISNHYVINNQCVSFWNFIQHLPVSDLYIKPKYILSNINKIKNVIETILKYPNIVKKYEFDEFLVTSLFYKDIVNNNYCYICNDIDYIDNHLTKYTNIFQIDTSKDDYQNYCKQLIYQFGNTYYLRNKNYIYDDLKPFDTVNVENNNVSNNNIILNVTKNKHLFLNIKRYMFDYINNVDFKNYDIQYQIYNNKNIENISQNKKKCCIYCVDDNKKMNNLLDISLQTFRRYNSIDVIIVTISNNIYINDIVKKYDNVNILYIDNFYKKYIKNIDKKVRKEISNFAYIKICLPLFDEIRNNYDYVFVSDCDIEYYHELHLEFLEFKDLDCDIIGHTNYDDSFCENRIKDILGDKYQYTNEYINCGYFIYNIKNKVFDKQNYLPLLLKYINISNENCLNNFEQDCLFIFHEINIKKFKKTYFDYCYTKEQYINHHDKTNLHYICDGKSIMLKNVLRKCNINIFEIKKQKVYIYSNCNPYDSYDLYAIKLKEFISKCNLDDIHIFLNTCVPYYKQIYDTKINYFVGRCVGNPLCFNGQSYLGQYISLDNSFNFKEKYIIGEMNHRFYKFEDYIVTQITTNDYLNTVNSIKEKYSNNRPLTTGLCTYLHFKQYYDYVYPINFYGVNPVDKFNYGHGDDFHLLSGEEKYYKDNNIEIIYV